MSQARLLTFEFLSLCTIVFLALCNVAVFYNALMYQVSAPEFRGYNANMLMLAVHCGSFLGPVVGGLLIEAGGYDLFFQGAMGVTVVAAGVMLVIRPG